MWEKSKSAKFRGWKAVESDDLEERQNAAIFMLWWSLAIYIERMEGSGVATFFFFDHRRVITMAAPNRNYELQKWTRQLLYI